MKIGYARVSTSDQNLENQIDVLKEHGCEKFFTDVISGSKVERKGLTDFFKIARTGDLIIVVRLDRLGRSLKDLIQLINLFEEKGIGFKSLAENIDTTTPTGKLIFHIFGALAEFERNLIIDRTNSGLARARKRGVVGGRPQKLTPKDTEHIRKLYQAGTTVREICTLFNVGSRSTIYRYLSTN